ncbi:MAG: GAF domain-containing protein [Actinomycetota bacterium]
MSERRRLEALIEAGMALGSARDLEPLLQKTADLAREVIEAQYAAVGVLGENGELIKFVYSGFDEETVRRIGRLPEGKGVLGVIIDEGRPLRLPEVSGHPRSAGFPAQHPQMHSFLGVPISARGRIFGRLYLTNKKDAAEFSAEDEQIALTFAAQAGVAVENVFLLEEVRRKTEELAVLEERDRIAKELHDGVIQSIYSVGLSLQGSYGLLEQDAERAKVRIDEAIAELDNVIRDVRSYIFELQPRELKDKGLVEAITDLARHLEVNTLAHVEIDIDESAVTSIGSEVEAEMIQIVREILSNIAKHAAAAEVSIHGVHSGNTLEVLIDDDGVGFDPSVVTGGLGLKNIQARASGIGGQFRIIRRKPKGTRHELRIPVESAEERND